MKISKKGLVFAIKGLIGMVCRNKYNKQPMVALLYGKHTLIRINW